MSLAMYAAPFDNESGDYKNNDTNNLIQKKKVTHNKTQKKYSRENFDEQKVNNVLETIHNESMATDDDESLGNFNPPPMSESIGVHKTIATEQMLNNSSKNNENMFKTLGRSPEPLYDNENLDLNNFNSNYGNNNTAEEYYKKYLPGYNAQKNPYNKPYYPNNNNNNYYVNNLETSSPINNNYTNDVLIQKLNYMIHLLEENQDEKTNNVTEEVVLYSFLGIFIIFVIDSFARVGKYVR
jgi:hypothetical protein